jgi:hypothetical protein
MANILWQLSKNITMTWPQWIELALVSPVIGSLFLLVASAEAEAQPESINVQNTVVMAPLTVVVPITADVQNAQICISAASSGDQSCSQVILNPEQNSYQTVNVDLSDPASIPAVSSATPGISKTITPGSQRSDVVSTNAPQPPVINLQNTVATQPLTVVIPIETDAQNAQICVTILSSGSQSCQQVTLDSEQGLYTPVTVDPSQPTPIITPQETAQTTSSPTSNQPQTINVEHTVVTAPITVTVPITGDVQNAQICVSAGTSGDQSCTQLIINPEQTSYTPVSTDLTTETPTFSSAVQQEPMTDSQQASASTPSEIATEPSTPTNEESSQSQSPEEAASEEQPLEMSEQGQDDDTGTPDTLEERADNEGQESSSGEDNSVGDS